MKKEKASNKSLIIYTIISIVVSIVAISIVAIPTLSVRIVEIISAFFFQKSFFDIVKILAKIFLLVLPVWILLKAREAREMVMCCMSKPSAIDIELELKNLLKVNVEACEAETDFTHRISDTNLLISYYQSREQTKKAAFSGRVQDQHVYILASTQSCSKELFYSVKSICDNMKLDTIHEYTIAEHKSYEMQLPIFSAQLIVVIFDKSDAELYYKLGIAHGLDKPTILLINSNDLSQGLITGRNVIYYSDLCDLKIKLAQGLKELL